MRIAIVVRFLPKYRHHLYEGLAERGHDVFVLHGPDIPGSKVVSSVMDSGTSVAAVRVTDRILRLSRATEFATPVGPLRTHLERIAPDVVLAEGMSNIGLSYPAMRWCRRRRVPLVWWTLGRLDNRPTPEKPKVRTAWEYAIRQFERRADAWLGYTERAMGYFRMQGYPADRCYWSGNVGDVAPYLEAGSGIELTLPTATSAPPHVLYAGALTPQKRVDLLVSAWPAVLAKCPGAILFVCGDGPSREALEAQAACSGSSIRFMGRVGEDLPRLVASARTVVLPGLGGVSIPEALAAGTPVVVSLADGTERDLVHERRTGRYFEAGSATDLARVLAEVINDPDSAAGMGRAGRQLVLNSFTTDAHVGRVESALIDVLKRRPTPT